MNDFFLRLSGNATARRLVSTLGLPVPMPPVLARSVEPISSRPLEGVRFCAAAGGALRGALVKALAALGATEADDGSVLLFDATTLTELAQLDDVYAFFHARVGALARNGRVLVIARPAAETTSPSQAATQRALEGFVRSVAKEVGKRGVTANLLRVHASAEDRLPAAVTFFASRRSVFVTGQTLEVSSVASGAGAAPFAQALTGKTVVVTGAANGIGAATARVLAREGAAVICVDRPAEEAPLRALASSLPRASVVLADLTKPEAVGAIAAAVPSELHGIVHSAGITRDKTLAKMSADQWRMVLDVNVEAVLRLHAALSPKLVAGGRVVCLSSIAGLAGNVGQTAYAASKAALVAWVAAEAALLGARGVCVNAVAPGFIETRMTAAIPLVVREVARRLSALSQGGQPEDVAEVIGFLCSPHAVGVTGQTLRVCGGAFIGA